MSRTVKPKFCGYSNCFRPFYKMRGFMPVCEYHYKHPKKWGEDGHTYTGSVFIKKKDSSEEKGIDEERRKEDLELTKKLRKFESDLTVVSKEG